MLRSCIIFLFLLTNSFLYSQHLSDSSKISLLTCAPGEELYSAFGHTGIRVTGVVWDGPSDLVFNYGTFDFGAPGFYTNFVKGDMMYMLTVDDFQDFRDQYISENRRVTEQELNLTPAERNFIFAFLTNNAQRENRTYRYDFFWDNCCTRPRDVFESALGPRLQYSYAGFDTSLTMREALKPYVKNKPWVDFGFDLILGLPCEVRATARNQTFLPDKLELLIQNAKVDGQAFVTANNVVVDLPVAPQPFKGITPILATFTILLLGIALGLLERFRNTHFWWFDFILFFSFGLLGMIFFLLGIFSSHYSLPQNLNCLWLLPTHCIVAFFFFKKHKPQWLQYYFIGNFVLLILLLLGWKWNPQPFNIAVLPLILLLANRSLKIFIRIKQLGLGHSGGPSAEIS